MVRAEGRSGGTGPPCLKYGCPDHPFLHLCFPKSKCRSVSSVRRLSNRPFVSTQHSTSLPNQHYQPPPFCPYNLRPTSSSGSDLGLKQPEGPHGGSYQNQSSSPCPRAVTSNAMPHRHCCRRLCKNPLKSRIWTLTDRSAAGKKEKPNKPLEKLALIG